jgi:GlpG protein
MFFQRQTIRIFCYRYFDVGGGALNRWKHGWSRFGRDWRLITPIFMHDLQISLHLFNMLWLRFWAPQSRCAEDEILLAMVFSQAWCQLGPVLWAGPAFWMSGVVYGLFGYIWMKTQLDPHSGFFLHPTNVAIMLIWLALGFTNIMPIANGAHAAGLVTGVAWGTIASYARR